jgi:hypothetical protein
MKTIIKSSVLAAVLVMALVATASAQTGWYENPGTSFDNGVVTLDNTQAGTSYENADLNVPVANGDDISFEYRVVGSDDSCSGGTPRVFIQGGLYNTHDASKNAGEDCESRTTAADGDGWRTVSGTVAGIQDGTAGYTGIVNDNPSNVRVIEVRNVIINGVNVTGPASKDACKNGGWQQGPAGYRNQGACVSAFAK